MGRSGRTFAKLRAPFLAAATVRVERRLVRANILCASCYSASGGCREEVCRGGCGSQCLEIEVRDAEVGNVGESFPGSAASSDFLVLPRRLPIKALQLLEG